VTVSKASRHDISSAFNISPQAIDIVHNGIDTEVFKPLPDVQQKPFRIMATASADAPLKGLDYLLKAIAILLPAHPALELLVVGKLKEDGETRKLIGKLDIGKHLKFVSGIETEEIVRLYAEATLVVVPSIYEGFGLPAGEAMACGVPVIATDGGALPEVVGNAGVTVPTRDEKAIADAIDDLLRDPIKRDQLGRKARARIVKLFSWKVAAEDMVGLYARVLDKKQEDADVPANR
jgi:glycosyltransferase involved in cell wall biosynthesis